MTPNELTREDLQRTEGWSGGQAGGGILELLCRSITTAELDHGQSQSIQECR
jgi:hypothetical protein